MNPRRLYRSADDRILAGVAGGLAAYLDVDPVIVRIIWFLSIFFTGSLTFWAYLIMTIVVPLEPTEWPPQSPWAPGGAPIGYNPGWVAPAPGTPGAETPPDSGGAPNAPEGPASAMPGTPPPSAPGGWWRDDWRSQWRQDRWQQRQERWQQRAESREYHGYGGPGLVFGLLLVLVGSLLAWHQFDPNFDLNVTWPIVTIAFGAILVFSSLRVRRKP